MNAKTRAAIKKAGAGRRPAGRMKLHYKAYPKPATLSSLKTSIGELLLFGNKARKETWWLLDSKLRHFCNLKFTRGSNE